EVRDMSLRIATALAALLLACGAAGATSTNLAPNPSFELGQTAPEGWTLSSPARWSAQAGRTGARSLAAVTGRATRVAVSRDIPADADQSYRLDGCLRCRRGRARIGFDVLDRSGSIIASAA